MKTKTKKVFAKIKKKKLEPLTLEAFINYNQKVLLPALEEKFAMKKELGDFRDSSLTNQDAILKNIDILLAEKEVV